MISTRIANRVGIIGIFVLTVLLRHSFDIAVAQAPEPSREFSVDDLLKLEGVGKAEIFVDNNIVVFERLRAFGETPAIGSQSNPARASHIYRVAVNGQTGARPLFPQEEKDIFWLGPTSPSGQKVVIFGIRSSLSVVGVFNFGNNELRWLSANPSMPIVGTGGVPVWLSESEIVLAAIPADRRPQLLKMPTASAENRIDLWQRAWAGKEPTATELRSGTLLAETPQHPNGQLIYFNLDDDTKRTFGSGRFNTLQLSPNGKYLAVLRDRGRVKPHVDAPLASYEPLSVKDVVVYDADNGMIVYECSSCDALVNSLRWASSSDSFLFFARSAGDEWTNGRYYRVNIGDGYEQPLLPENFSGVSSKGQFSFRSVEPFWLGDIPIVLAKELSTEQSRSGQKRSDWLAITPGSTINLTKSFSSTPPSPIFLSESHVVFLHDGEVWRVDALGKRSQLLIGISGLCTVTVPEYSYTRQQLRGERFLVLSDACRAAAKPTTYIIDIESGEFETVELPSTQTEILAYRTGGPGVVFKSDNDCGGSLSISTTSGDHEVLYTYNEHLSDVRPSRIEKISYRNEIGQELFAWLMLPHGHKTGDRHPTIVFGYPQSVISEHSKSPPFRMSSASYLSPYLLNSEGYAFLIVSMPLTIDGSSGNRIDQLVGNSIPAINEAVKQGFVDGDRLGVMGASQASYVATGLISQTSVFKAGVVYAAGFQNLTSFFGIISPGSYGEPDDIWPMYYAGFTESFLPGPPWHYPDEYIYNSPLFHADKINAPILFAHGDLDIYPLTQSEEMFSALYRQQKDAILVRYWGEGHNLNSPANIRDFWERTISWYNRYLTKTVE